MKITAKCLSVQKYLGNICVDSGQVTTDEMLPPQPRVHDGKVVMVSEAVHPAGPGKPIFVNKETIMFRVNFSFQQLPIVGDLTLVGVTEDKYKEGQDYSIEIAIS